MRSCSAQQTKALRAIEELEAMGEVDLLPLWDLHTILYLGSMVFQ